MGNIQEGSDQYEGDYTQYQTSWEAGEVYGYTNDANPFAKTDPREDAGPPVQILKS